MYTVAILSVCSIAMSKAAMLFFHLRITPQRSQRLTCYALVAVCVIWMIVAITLVGTRCGNHHPWKLYGRTCDNFVSSLAIRAKPGDTDRCTMQTNRWVGIAVTDSLLELAIFAIPIWILWDVSTQRSYKAMILVAFASRLFVPIWAGVHASTAADWAYGVPAFEPVRAVLPFVWLNVETNYAILAATFPTLGTFVKSLNTRWGALDGPDVAQYAMESLSEQSRNSNRVVNGRRDLTMDTDVPRLRPEGSTYSFKVRSPPLSSREDAPRNRTRGSDASDQMIIRKMVSTSVETDSQKA
jgi:hypothetical protein